MTGTRATFARIQEIEPLVRKCVPIQQKIHRLSRRLRTPKEVEKALPGFIAFTDCTEQQIPRHRNKTRRKAYYSGKKKMHSVKTQLMVNNQRVITYKTGHKKGKMHDYTTYKENHPADPNKLSACLTLEIGVEKDFPELSSIPNRKKRSQKDLAKEKKSTTRITPEKGVLEHTIYRMKKYRIIVDIFRNSIKKY